MEDLGTVCAQHEIDEIVISSMKMSEERIQRADLGEADAITMEDRVAVKDTRVVPGCSRLMYASLKILMLRRAWCFTFDAMQASYNNIWMPRALPRGCFTSDPMLTRFSDNGLEPLMLCTSRYNDFSTSFPLFTLCMVSSHNNIWMPRLALDY